MSYSVILLLLSAPALWAQVPPTPLNSEREVSHALLNIYQKSPRTFFCDFMIDPQGQLPTAPKTLAKPSAKVSWQLVISKKKLAQDRDCYLHKVCLDSHHQRFKGLRCCQKSDKTYQIMLYDLHNRLPTHPDVKRRLDAYTIGILPDEKNSERFYSLKLDSKRKLMEPPDEKKGEIARIILYMHDTYHIPIEQAALAQYTAWHQTFPPSNWEKFKNFAIAQAQGNINPYIAND